MNLDHILDNERQRRRRFESKILPVMLLWKGDLIEAFAGRLLYTWLALHYHGITLFGPDDCPDAYYPKESDVEDASHAGGIPGMAVKLLKSGDAPIIKPFWGDDPKRGIFHGRRTSLRDSANGRKVFLYQFNRIDLAEKLVRAQGLSLPQKPQPQQELAYA